MTIKHLLSSAAAVALLSSAAFAEMDKTAGADTTYEAAKADAKAAAETLKSDAEAMSDSAGEKIDETASSIANATSEMAQDAEDAATELAKDAETAIDSTADEVTTTANDMANAVETELEAADKRPLATETNDWDMNWGDDAGTLTVADIIGMNVVNEDGDVIGEIDYVVGSENRPMGIIGIGGFLGLGEYTVSVPLEEFSMKDDETLLLVGATEDALKTRPEYDESDAENISDDIPLGDLLTGAYFTSAS